MAGIDRVDARVAAAAGLEVLSQNEVARLSQASRGDLYELFRRCSLAVLNSGSQVDDAEQLLALHRDFAIEVVTLDRGIKLDLSGAPGHAFVDGELIEGIRRHLFSVLRDIIFERGEIQARRNVDLETSRGLTEAVFLLLRNAGVLLAGREPNIVVCWGGHSISREEYEYTKRVGYELGLRGLDICTGCGPGAMKGPMKGAAIAHAKQRVGDGRYIGITEPGIIAAESPNPIVDELVIMPDIEKRLEAFVRLGHGIIVFPGGVGTAEEILFLLGVLMHPDNQGLPFPLVLTGPKSRAGYFEQIDAFLRDTIGSSVTQRYRIIVDDPVAVAQELKRGLQFVGEHRRKYNDSFHFNWRLNIDLAFQQPFSPTHENMAGLKLNCALPAHELAVNLRRAFSGIVAGNVKSEGLQAIRENGMFKLRGDPKLAVHMDQLLTSFVKQNRMKLPGSQYKPCYEISRA